MKLSIITMTNFFRNILLLSCLAGSVEGVAQSTTSSPYSQFGLGLIKGSQLPESRSMAGLAAGLRKPSVYSNVNIANPASYSSLRITTFDVGVFAGLGELSTGSVSENTFDASLNHLIFGMPVTKTSALSFGLLPYSTKGYNYSRTGTVGGEEVNYVNSATGGISKAYLGYGIKLGKRLSVGANASYLFGKLSESQAAEYDDFSFLNSRTQINESVSGFNFDYGIQYETPVSKRVNLILGYTGSSDSKINLRSNNLTTRYYTDATSGVGGVAVDTTQFIQNPKSNIQLPLMHTLGFVLQRNNKWLVGADVTMGQWENFRKGNVNPGLQNSMGIAVGSQITPDITAVGSYFKLVDYRFGFKYDKTHINLNNQDVNEMGITLGLGLPLPANRSTFYKINLGTELGQRGSLKNGQIRERFVNIFLSFTMNDQWFQKYKFD